MKIFVLNTLKTLAKTLKKVLDSSCPLPKSLWLRFHNDYAGPFYNRNILLVVHAYTKWPDVFIMKRANATETVSKLTELLSRFAMPEVLVANKFC